jgi:hypothetical protein
LQELKHNKQNHCWFSYWCKNISSNLFCSFETTLLLFLWSNFITKSLFIDGKLIYESYFSQMGLAKNDINYLLMWSIWFQVFRKKIYNKLEFLWQLVKLIEKLILKSILNGTTNKNWFFLITDFKRYLCHT